MPEPGGGAGVEAGGGAGGGTPPRLQLLTRDGCHLCLAAAETLQRLAAEVDAGVGLVDVDTDPELQAEYGDRVPVVLLDGREHSYFTVDVDRLRADLRAGR